MKVPQAIDHHPTHGHGPGCLDVPHLDRLTYFYGQMLTPQHLQRAQASIYDRARLHNRALHGWGVVCGLEVKPGPSPAPPCPPGDGCGSDSSVDAKTAPEALKDPVTGKPYRTTIEVDCGIALDCAGNELVVRTPRSLDVMATLSPKDRSAVETSPKVTLYVSLCYHTYGIEPTRPMASDACSQPSECSYGFYRDGASVQITREAPAQDDRCEQCHTSCPAECVLLAQIDDFVPGQPLEAKQIHNSVRRPLSLYMPTVISEVGWQHGATYTSDDAGDLLWKTGLTVRFSRPILAETLKPGVFDVFIMEGGLGRTSAVRVLNGEFTQLAGKQEVSEFRYTMTYSENLDQGDRILLVLRTDFLLDSCCRPVAGNHVGGRVPQIKDLSLPSPVIPAPVTPSAITPPPVTPSPVTPCQRSPQRLGPWTSGTGSPGGTFESWFFIEDKIKSKEKTK